MQNLSTNLLALGALGLGGGLFNGLGGLGSFISASKDHTGPRGSWTTRHSSGTRQRRRRQLQRRTGRRG